MKKTLLILLLVLAPLVVGCASTKTVTVRTTLPPPGTAGKATTTVVTPQQKHVAPVEEDPRITQVRAVGRQMAIDLKFWNDACFELRNEAIKGGVPVDYDICYEVLGEKPYVNNSYGYRGRSVGGSVINNSRGVGWR